VNGWRPQHYARTAQEAGVPAEVVTRALAAAGFVHSVNAGLAPIFTLRHLAHEADVDYGLLRAVVRRQNEDPYRVFRIRKRPSYPGELRFRVIAVPEPHLLQTQRWITRNILSRGSAPFCECRILARQLHSSRSRTPQVRRVAYQARRPQLLRVH